mmetsp:Transcript_6591/g.14018  ORF Transcript_6591/g.14018 Transcript_6591/m.14018 type:complete len:1056 (+) Transcript_6591:730-3897(+)
MRDIGNGDLGRIQVLESDINLLQGGLEKISLLFHHTGLVGVEGESLTGQELLLQLFLTFPSSVLDRKTNIGGVRSSRVGEDTASGFAKRNIEFLSGFHGVLSDEVHLGWLIGLGGHLDTAIHQVHLVDEQITEDTGARNNDIDTRTSEFFERDKLDLVDTSKRIRNWSDTNQGQHLGQRFSVGFDVIGTPQSEGNGLRELSSVLDLELLQQLVGDALGNFHGGLGRDRTRIQGVHVTSGRKDIGVTDRISTGGRHQEVSVEKLHDSSKLVVGNNLLQAELEVLHDTLEAFFGNIGESGLHDGFGPRFLLSYKRVEHGTDVGEGRLDLLDTSVSIGRLVDKGTGGSTGGFGDLSVELDILELSLVISTVDIVDVTADRGSNDTGKALDLVIGAIQLGNVDEGGNGFFGRRWDTNGVETARQQTGLDLHDLGVDLSNNVVAVLGSVVGGIVGLEVGKVDVLVQVTGVRRRDDRVDNGGSTGHVLSQSTVGFDELLEFLQTLVQTGVLGGGSQVRNGGGVRTTLGNGGLGRIVGGIKVGTWQGVDQTIRVASSGHTDLLTGHEFQTSVGSEMENGVGTEDLLEVRVVSGESVVRTGGLGKQQSHGISLVTERRLDSNEDVSELLSVDNKVLAIGVKVSWSRAPVLFEVSGIRGEVVVFLGAHSVLYVELGGRDLGLRVIEDGFHDFFLGLRGLTNVVSLRLELLQNSLDGVKDIQVGGGSNVTLIGGEGEDGDGNLLVLLFLVLEVGPLQRAFGEKVDAIGQGDGSSGSTLTSGKDDGLNGSINLRKGNLEGDLDRMQTELTGLPLFKGLEDQGDGAQVRDVQVLENLGGLLVILRGRSSNEGESGKVDDGINNDLSVGVLEVVVDGSGVIQTTGVDRNDAGSSGFKLGDQGDVVCVVLGVDVGLLQQDSYRRSGVDVNSGIGAELTVVPPHVLTVGLKDNIGCDWMPDGLVGEEDGLNGCELFLAFHILSNVRDVVLSDHLEERLDVLGRSTQPVLEGHHKGAGIGGLVGGQEFEDLGKGSQQLKHTLLERGSVFLLLLLHEIGDNGLGLSEILHGE